jgi:hypothetical protein
VIEDPSDPNFVAPTTLEQSDPGIDIKTGSTSEQSNKTGTKEGNGT